MTREHGTEQTQAAAGTGILEQEHLAIHRVVAAMAGLADELEHASAPDAQTLDGLVSFLRVFVDDCHHTKEDRWLFPMLEAKGDSFRRVSDRSAATRTREGTCAGGSTGRSRAIV
jgi:hemerythrin-like domain-containing protein